MTLPHFRQAAILITVMLLLLTLYRTVVNPMDQERLALTEALDAIPAQAPLDDHRGQDYAQVMQRIDRVPHLWQELVAPPPAPAPTAPPRPNAPDLDAMLSDINVGKAQIGTTKIKIFSPESPRGEWVSLGAVINGCTLESFTSDEAVFRYYWEAGDETLRLAIPRQ